jgi:hypothetical protein
MVQDVRLLREGVKKYREEGLAMTGVDPLTCLTKASWALKTFRSKFKDDCAQMDNLSKPTAEKYVIPAFYGGRTNCIRKRYTCKPDEFIYAIDISSQYPAVQSLDVLPGKFVSTMDTEIVGEDECHRYLEKIDQEGMVGYFKVDVSCPKQLFIPVLPEKQELGKKLMFTLHDKEKASYYTKELILALKKGYKITKIHHAILFEGVRGIFKNYMDYFYKIKNDIKNEIAQRKPEGEELSAMITRYENAKLMCNSLWGKLAESKEYKTYEILNNPAAWDAMIRDQLKHHVRVIWNSEEPHFTRNGEDFIEVEWVKENDIGTKAGTIHIGAAITASARIRLYEALDHYDTNLLYFDSDSAYYIGKKDQYIPFVSKAEHQVGELGYGEWELDKGKCGDDFVSIGPKAYSIRKNGEQVLMRSKGLANHLVSFEEYASIVEASFESEKSQEIVKNVGVQFEKKHGELFVSDSMTKIIRDTCDKRWYLGPSCKYMSYPWGYNWQVA